MSNHLPTDTSDVPIRLFKSNFMEFFTHVTPVAILILWTPVGIYFLYSEISTGYAQQAGWLYIPGAFILGAFLWTFAEYTLHRYLFHFEPKSEKMQRFFFLFHGVHHAQPQCKTRLVMPPVLSIPMGLITYGVMYLIFTVALGLPHFLGPVMCGFLVGYLFYDITHYATHHFRMRNGIWKWLKRYHMQHHYKTPDQRYGVSSPLWDIVFGTKPA